MYLKKRKLLMLLSILLIATIAVNMMETVNANNITISPTTPGGLKTAIKIAENGSTIFMENGVYNGTNNRGLLIERNLTIQGKGKNVVIDAEGKGRVFSFRAYNNLTIYIPSVTLSNLKIKNGYSKHGFGGAIQGAVCNLTLKDCTFTNNQASHGGAVHSANNVLNCTFKNNIASISGGAIVSVGNVINCTFTNNKASNKKVGVVGGAINNANYVINCIFTNNQAKTSGTAFYQSKTCGGAISNANYVINSTFTNNKAINGGAIHSIGKYIGDDEFFTKNTRANGRAINTSDFVINCNFTKNKANYGGAIYSFGRSIKNCKFTNNQATKSGGAIFGAKVVSFATYSISACTFKNNKATFHGGAIRAYFSFNMINSVFNKNKAVKGNGGAIICVKKDVWIKNTSFKNNIAKKRYNAFYCSGKAKVIRSKVTITPKNGVKVKK